MQLCSNVCCITDSEVRQRGSQSFTCSCSCNRSCCINHCSSKASHEHQNKFVCIAGSGLDSEAARTSHDSASVIEAPDFMPASTKQALNNIWICCYTADSGSDSEAASPSHAPAAATEAAASAAASSPADAAAASNVQREDWMTKSFPKAAANADAVPLPGAKPVEKKVWFMVAIKYIYMTHFPVMHCQVIYEQKDPFQCRQHLALKSACGSTC